MNDDSNLVLNIGDLEEKHRMRETSYNAPFQNSLLTSRVIAQPNMSKDETDKRHEDSLIIDFDSLKQRFHRFDSKLSDTYNKKINESSKLSFIIKTIKIDALVEKIRSALNKQRAILIELVQCKFLSIIREAESTCNYAQNMKEYAKKSDAAEKFRERVDKNLHVHGRLNESKKSLNKWSELIIGELVHKNDFTINEKLKYLRFFKPYEVQLIEEFKDPFNVRIVGVSRSKFFVYTKSNNLSHLKLIDSKCNELASIKVDARLICRQLLGYRRNLVVLFYDSVNKLFLLHVYDDDLNLTAAKQFTDDLRLCSLNQTEIVIWHAQTKVCAIFNYKLEKTNAYGQDTSATEPFYFEPGMLIDASANHILFYFHNLDEQKQFIKIIERKAGRICGLIDYKFNSFSRMIKFDSKSNVLLKSSDPTNTIKYYDITGSFIIEIANNQITEISNFSLTNRDELIFYDTTHNRIIFI